MTKDWSLILKVIFGCATLVLVMIYGLTRMGGNANGLTTDQEVLLAGAGLVKNNGEVKVNVVVFSDMQCPACRLADLRTGSLESMDGVRYVFRHYPLSIHKYSVISARAVEAARVMGKGFEMKKLLFEKQSEWSAEPKIEEKLVEFGASLGLEANLFKEKLNSKEVETVVRDDMALGDSLKLAGTPTIFVNGEQVSSDFVMIKVTELLKLK